MFLKNLIVGCIFLLLASGPGSSAALPPGTMEGHLKIVSPRAVEPSDDMPRPAVAPDTYAKFPLIILSQAGEKQIAHLTPDKNGKYRVALPPGAYILDVQDRVAKHIRAAPQRFTVVSNQTVHVDMNVVIGMHRLQPDGADR
jgi:hypothetical protein